MASSVQQCVLSPLPLTALKSNNNVVEEGLGRDGLRGGSASGSSRDQEALLVATQTPTSSSSDRTSERRDDDPVALLSHPVEGFHHPRQHLFTDRLVGRFYEDTSLDAETRKTSKCLAGRLGTAGSNATATRPNTTAGGAASLRSRSLHSSTAGRCGKRMFGGASGHSQGMSKGGSARPQAGGVVGTALSGRKEQVQKEIMEQKALIEKLEEKMASLSSRGGRSSKSDNSAVHAAAADARRSTAQNQDDNGDRLEDVGRGPDVTQRPECVGRASRGEGILVDSEYYSGDAKAAEHGSTAGRELGPADGYPSQAGPGRTRRRSREEDASAVVIQRNVRGGGRRKSFLRLQSARDEFVRNLQSVVSAATSLTRQTQQPKPPTTVVDSESSSSSTSRVGQVQGIYTAAERMMETSREEGLATPPFDTLRALHSGMTNIEESLVTLKADVDGGRATGMGEHIHEPCAAMAESCRAARRALGILVEAVGADAVIGELTSTGSSAASPAIPRDHLNSPAGSGRAAAVAMASAREGLLTSPDSCGRVERPNAENKERIQELLGDRGDTDQSPPVPLNTLGVEGIGLLLRLHGFEEHAAGFLAQAVDGVMLSDPNLCEADFAELGLGGDAAGADECRARMVSFFRRCQEQGAIVHYRDREVARPGAEAAAGASESGLSQRRYASQTNERKQAGGDSGGVEDIRAGCSVVGGPGDDRMVSDPLWDRHAAQSEPRRQQIIADISVDAGEGAARGDDRRISVKLNAGVVVTVGGVEADLIDDADRLSDVETEDENAGGRSGKSPPVIPGAPPTNRKDRRTSVGFRQVTLEADPARNGERGSPDGGDKRLSPGISVTTADVTLNVFNDGEFRP